MYVLCYFYAVEVNLFVGWFCFLSDNSLFVVAWAVIIDMAFHCARVLYFSYHELLTHQLSSLPCLTNTPQICLFPTRNGTGRFFMQVDLLSTSGVSGFGLR